MASGQQKTQQNLEAFEVWKATQTDDEFKQIVFRGQLNRTEVAIVSLRNYSVADITTGITVLSANQTV